ncbi:MAG: hypothetical protein WD099_08305 [Dongiaceae bacterium]
MNITMAISNMPMIKRNRIGAASANSTAALAAVHRKTPGRPRRVFIVIALAFGDRVHRRDPQPVSSQPEIN